MRGALDERKVNSQSHHLLDDCLTPCLEHRELLGDAVDGGGASSHVVQVGLVKHVWVVVEAHKMANVGVFLDSEERIPITAAGRSVDPLGNCAGWKLAVVVDVGSPAGNNGGPSVSIVGDSADEWPHVVLLIHQDRASIITDDVLDYVIEPRLDSISVVHTSDCRRNDTIRAESGCGCDADLLEPCLVPGDLSGDIKVGSIVLILVSEGMRYVCECVEISWLREPDLEIIQVGARSSVRIGCRS